MSTVHHVMSHELKSLEQFVASGLAALPKLSGEASTRAAFQTCSSYHAKCSALLRQVLGHVGQYSPKHCKLISDIWDVASINVLMLLKVAQASTQEHAQASEDYTQASRFRQECDAEQAAHTKALAGTVDNLKYEIRQLKAELQTVQRKLTRSRFEKERLERILDKVTREEDPSDADDPVDQTADDANEDDFMQLLHNVDKYQQVSSLESAVDDLDKLFAAVDAENHNQLSALSELDRYIDSSMVSILWKHQPKPNQSAFVAKMFSIASQATQTDDPAKVVDADTADRDDEASQTPRTRKKLLVIPTAIRALLDAVPRVPKMLLKKSLTHNIWLLLLRKLESERVKPGASLPVFLRDYFVQKFGLKALADYHLVELVKSCLLYRRKLEHAAALLEADPSGCNLAWDDARILLFGRCLEAYPDEALASAHLPSDGVATLLDYLGDVLELDPAFPSLQVVQDIDGPVAVSREVAAVVWRCHFSYMGPDEERKALYAIGEHDLGSPQTVDLDWLLSYALYAWHAYDAAEETALREAFRAVLLHSSGSHTANLLLQMDGFVAAILAVWPDFPEATAQTLYMDMMAAKRENFRLASERRRRDKQRGAPASGHVPATTVLGIDGVFEEEFVAVVAKLRRNQRKRWGIRTRGLALLVVSKNAWVGGMGRPVGVGPIEPASLKPGLCGL
ncbi:hypothetical protein ACHHYP_16089 [Achlya hypogyna]|uniref:Uncharacterized protein n=1 Tax=Achlya hypogyna TaxID=1202772 RepID=A0A1V9Y9P3_ACHHY|nr:hypothetical protein ACHHYP_16089 [Achlya hypogyna]